jgi:hypothetical protein
MPNNSNMFDYYYQADMSQFEVPQFMFNFNMPQTLPFPNFNVPCVNNNIWSSYNNTNILTNNSTDYSNLFKSKINFKLSSEVENPFAKQKKENYYSFNNTANTNIKSINAQDVSRYGVTEKTLPNGTKVLACSWSKFDKCRPEWIEQAEYLLKSAKQHGFTILFSDATRTVEESNRARARKGSIVCRGGESPHNYGVAFDIVCYKDGKAVSVDSPEYKAFAQTAVQLSNNKIEWGGEWRKKGEKHHFNIRNWQYSYKKPNYLVG